MGIKCQVCGSQMIMKRENDFVCMDCGVMYSYEEIQRMIKQMNMLRVNPVLDEQNVSEPGWSIDGAVLKKYKPPMKKLTELVVPAEINGQKIREIGELSFGYAHNSEDEDTPAPGEDLKRVIISDGIMVIKRNAFRDLNIEEVVLPDSICKIDGWAFKNCSKLRTIHFGSMAKRKITLGLNAFDGCRSLQELLIKQSTWDNVHLINAGVVLSIGEG